MRNLSELSLKNKDLVWYFIIVFFLGGIYSYFKLGRMEDPDFTIRQMVVTAAWPGATADRMGEQVTDKLEKKFQDVPGLDYLKSYSRAGQTVIYINLKDTVPKEQIRSTWRDVRNFGEDIKRELPEGVYGPFFNDRFDDVFGTVYALTGDGFSYEELRVEAEKIRRLILNLESVQKVELLGVQTEKVYVEVEQAKLAQLGISPQAVANALKTQNEITTAGMLDTATDNVYVRFTGVFDDVEAIKNAPINAGGSILRLGDIAKVERRYAEPADEKMYYNGRPAVGIAVSMEPGGNIIALGESLETLISRAAGDVPLGMEIGRVANQAKIVEESISEFVGSLREAVVIVLLVSLLSLGTRTGMVVAACIPLVLAGTFCVMYFLGIDLHKVSLGALIISLGLLVDDEIIAVEMISVKLEQGMDHLRAAAETFRTCASSMLTGTLITCAGFIPVAFSKGDASEFCGALFPVISTTLLLSWVVAVMVTPFFASYLIKTVKAEAVQELYTGRFYQLFRKVLDFSLRRRWLTMGVTAAVFAASLGALDMVRQEFFPASVRPEIIVDLRLPEGSSMQATEKVALRLTKYLDGETEDIESYTCYVGESAPRFVLTFEPELPAPNFAQVIINAKDYKHRQALEKRLEQELNDNFPEARTNMSFIQTGPPAPYPVMLRVSGYDKSEVHRLANEMAARLRQDNNFKNVHLDWNEKSKVAHLELDQDKLRAMGISPQVLAQSLYTELSGASVAQYYRGDRTISVDVRLAKDERSDLAKLRSLPVYLGQAGYVPLEQVAKISFAAEDGLIWRRDLKPTITVQSDIVSGTANDATVKAYEMLKDIRDALPLGYSIEVDGAEEMSEKSQRYLLDPIPAMCLVIASLLMIELRGARRLILTLLTVPLGLIGVAWGMLLFDQSMGFVAVLGVLALSGMIVRNSVILLDQIKRHLAEGETQWNAVINSAVVRFRPIMLTAGTSIVGMVPLMFSDFWGPMAFAISGGLLVATALTLLVLPTMYVIAYRVDAPE